MAYNFLGLVNHVNERVNEVQLTEANFASATNFYSTAKQSVNAALRHINTQTFEWPFNHITAEETLSEGVTRYPFPYDAKSIDFDTFRIKRDDTLGNRTSKLKLISYEEYLDSFVDQEYNTTKYDLPTYVFRAPDGTFGLVPAPDKAYEVVYEYYRLPIDLNLPTDVPDVPEHFKHVIVDGAMYYVYLFRNSQEEAQLSYQLFTQGLDAMRTIYVNRYDYLRDTVIHRGSQQSGYFRG